MKKILLFIWQLPQNILGSILSFKYSSKESYNGYTIYYKSFFNSGISLGNFIILDKNIKLYYKNNSIKHEIGHSKQSKILDPFYLVIIGIPSFLGNIYNRIFHKKWNSKKRNKWYYNQSWEKWADTLGNVQR